MIKKDCVSVIIPVYNRENMIGNAIESVLSQSHSNLELMVIDDGSTDNTKDILKSFDDDRIVLIETNHNGAYVARNIGIENSRGEYLAFLDSDDVWLPGKLQKQVVVAKNNHVDFVFTNGYILKESESGYRMYLAIKADSDRYRGKRYAELLRQDFIATSSVMLKRNIIDDVGYFIAENRGVLDYEMWLRIARKYEIDFMVEPLFLYKSHSNSLSGNRVARLHDLLYVYNLQEKWCTQNGLKNERKIVRGSISRTFMKLGLFYYNTRKGSTARKYFVKALTSRDIYLYSRIWSLACIVMPYPIYQRLYNYYVDLKLNLIRALGGKITPKGALKYMLLTFLHRIWHPKQKG